MTLTTTSFLFDNYARHVRAFHFVTQTTKNTLIVTDSVSTLISEDEAQELNQQEMMR